MAGWGRCRRCKEPVWWGKNPRDPERAFPFDDEGEQQSHFATCEAQEWVTDEDGDRHTTSKCRACGSKVWWETTARGARRPMDVDGETATWECHFDTCTGETAEQKRRREAQQEQEHANRQRAEDDAWRRKHYAAADAPYEIRLWLPDLETQWPCSFADVTSAFRRLAMKHHPDMGGQASEFIRIRLAYDALKKYQHMFRVEARV